MITGDHKDTAAAIASEIGILVPKSEDGSGKVLTGSDLDKLSDEEFKNMQRMLQIW